MIYNSDQFTEYLLPLLERFCIDNDNEVRSTIASQFHEIVKLRSLNEQSALLNPFVELLCSGTAEVVQHLMGNLHETFPPLYIGFKKSKINEVNNTSSRRGSFGGGSIVCLI